MANPIEFDTLKAAVDTAKAESKRLSNAFSTLSKQAALGNISAARMSLRSCTSLNDKIIAAINEADGLLSTGVVAEYLASREFYDSLALECEKLNLKLHDHGSTWYCFPSTIKVLSAEEAILINGVRTQNLNPSAIAATLKSEHEAATEKDPKQFLQVLCQAYGAWASHCEYAPDSPPLATVSDLFALLTLWPEVKRHYSKAQFALDLYLLDRGGITEINGKQLVFSASSGARDRTKTVQVHDEYGSEKAYYGLYFVNAATKTR